MGAFGLSINPSDTGAMDASIRNPVVRGFDGFEYFEWCGRCRITSAATATFNIHRFDSQGRVEANRALIVPANTLITSLGFYFDDAPDSANKARNNRSLTHTTAAGKLKLAPTLTTNTAGIFLSSPAASSNVLANIPFSTTLTNGVWNVTPVSVGSSDVTYQLFATDGNATEASSAASSVSVTGGDLEIVVWIAGKIRRVPNPAEVTRRNEGILWS
jgi:hypothetical protein